MGPVDLIDTVRNTGAVREFTAEPAAYEVVGRILDNARSRCGFRCGAVPAD